MSQDPFTNFINFIECDHSLARNRLEVEFFKKEVTRLLVEEENEQRRLDGLKERVQTLHNEIRAYELEAQVKRARQKDIQKRLLEITNAREYTALHHELEELERSKARMEDKWLESSESHEAAKDTYNKEQQKWEGWQKEQKASIDAKKASLEALESQRVRMEEQCAALHAKVTPEFLEEYTAMKRLVDDPVVPVNNLFCSACNQQITTHDMSLLRKHVLLACKECYRKLYLPL